MAEAARRTGLWASPAISTSYWAQVERGESTPTAPVLLRMALACDATPEEIHGLFHAAGYGHLHDTLAALGPTAETLPDTAEAGILADPRLPYDKRLILLDHLSDTLDALQTRLRRVAEERPHPPGA